MLVDPYLCWNSGSTEHQRFHRSGGEEEYDSSTRSFHHAGPEAGRAVQQLSVVDEYVIPVCASRLFLLAQRKRPPVLHFLGAQWLNRSEIRGTMLTIEQATSVQRAHMQHLGTQKVSDAA